jgi:argininosuccinate lyase
VLGDFVASAAALKSLPSTYNLDFQEITPKLWEAIENTHSALDMFAKLIPNLKVSADVSSKALTSFSAATELANMLVRKYNVPFRSAHKIVGSLVKLLIESKQTFLNATPELLQQIAQAAVGIKLVVKAEDITESIDALKIVETYKVKGGPAPTEVKRALTVRKKRLVLAKSNVSKLKQKLDEAESKLEATVKSYSNADSTENTTFKNSKLQVV